MSQRMGIGAGESAAAAEVYRRYEEVMNDGEVTPAEDAWVRDGHEASCDAADRSRVTLQTVATVAHCGLAPRRARELVAEWRLIAGVSDEDEAA